MILDEIIHFTPEPLVSLVGLVPLVAVADLFEERIDLGELVDSHAPKVIAALQNEAMPTSNNSVIVFWH
jgi:hypothetical protein